MRLPQLTFALLLSTGLVAACGGGGDPPDATMDAMTLDGSADTGAVCGDGIREAGEACDGVDTPTCAELTFGLGETACDDRCALDVSACTAAPVCGNGVVEPGERCDPCEACDDGIACTEDRETGSATSCDLVCTHEPLTACVDGDGCCPAGCGTSDSTADSDCSSTCGNGTIERGETCGARVSIRLHAGCERVLGRARREPLSR